MEPPAAFRTNAARWARGMLVDAYEHLHGGIRPAVTGGQHRSRTQAFSRSAS
ncbi:hypothetical protein KCH_38420 [Kitasatospora cheerisanensis KCTC 2395]|uniref:Uncharacterized protein n=1 Tax=Kitasatospora cheerisanensis KCTC 2395 TaxID=1348663 RepID=A0A066Z131_9ACTN|nr:hypothetical protein KCH_38420 [Kitasatospora cheerisanensis KCTC 2395]